MFRQMRRSAQQLSEAESIDILRRGTSGVLAVQGDGGYPYAVPLSYVYAERRLYFHCATSGHKLDALARDARASFCVIDRDEVLPERFTTAYRSVIVFGRARILNDAGEKRRAIELLAEKYAPEYMTEGRREIERTFSRFHIIGLTIEHMSGKQAREFLNA